ncbi:MAG: L,D-transpeptidase, partial [Butyrivibrio sp.]|nr:L,D-transpeptidase [Butyrivibrio sp.]
HTYLRGVDYVSYVNYWLGVNKGVGIHDANWRSKFGEEIYKSDGSHGCINCPYDSVEVLWDVVDIGTPVILYY